MSSQCPTADRLAALLKDALSQSERTSLETHLEECVTCREKLNALAGGGEAWFNVATAEDDPEVEALLARLKPEESGERIGPYKLLQQVGEGGFGTVWMAEQSEPVKRRVALKIIKMGMDTKEVVARFEQERQALAMMDHPNIAKVFDAGATQWGRPFFVMELVRGVPITEYCDEQKLAVRERLALFIQVCHALQHAHQKGIIHRDLKPSNILISTGDDHDPVPKIIDFGVAKAVDRTLTDKTLFTQFEQMIGTPTYMSPEQAGVGPMDIDTRSDIYSLGVLLYELLTGKPPFDPDELRKAGHDEMRRVIREEEPPRPSTRLSTLKDIDLTAVATRRHVDAEKLASMVRGDLDWIVMKALDKNRNRRYDTANGFALDVRRYLQSEPVFARPPSYSYKAGKFIRKYKGPVAAAAAVIVALIAGLVASTILYLRVKAAWSSEATHRAAAERHAQAEGAARMGEEIERAKAQALNKQAARSDCAVAEERLRAGDGPAAFARLARACEYDPASTLPAEKAIAALNLWQYRLPAAIFRGHTGGIRMAQFSPDGARVLTASDDNTARVWETQSGKLLATLAGHGGSVWSAQFSPDGARVVTASADITVRVWETQSGKLLATLAGHEREVTSAQFSPDGARILTASADKTARVWETQSGKLLATLAGHTANVYSAQFSADGARVVTASADKTARVWETQSGKLLATLAGHTANVYSAQFSADGARVVTAAADITARVWEAQSGKLLATLRHEGEVRNAQFSPDGARILTASWDKTARVWETQSGKLLTTLTGHEHFVSSAQFSADGARVLTASDDKTARVWETQSGKLLATLAGHEAEVSSAQFSADGTRVLTASDDKTARVWESGKLLVTLTGHEDRVLGAQFSADGARVVTASADKTARVWETQSGMLLTTLTGHEDWVLSAQFSADGARVVTASWDKTARVWETQSGKLLATLAGHGGRTKHYGMPVRREEWVMSAQFSADGARIVTASADTASADTTVRVWETQSGKLLATLAGHGASVYGAQFSPDGARILTASGDRTARVWETQSGKLLATLAGHEASVYSAQFSPDGARVVTASFNTARVWETQSGKLLATLAGHEDSVWSAHFSPDGARIVTASDDRTARVWEAQSGKLLATLTGHEREVTSAQFSPDGARILTATAGTVRVWETQSGKLLATLTGHERWLYSAPFSPDGARILTASQDKTARVWHLLPPGAGPPPEWFSDFLRYMAQMRLNPDGELETLKPDDWLALREKLREVRRASTGKDSFYLNVLGRFVKYPDEESRLIKTRQDLLARSREMNGEQHRDTLNSMEALAEAYAAAGRQDALQMRQDILVLSRKVFGPEQPETLRALIELESSYVSTGHPEKALETREEILALRRKINGPEHPDTRRAIQNLYRSYRDAGLWDKALPLMAEWSAGEPSDTVFALKVCTLQAWLGKNADHVATCRRVLGLAGGTDDPSVADRAAKGYCLLPSSDPQLLETVLALARRAVDLGQRHRYLPYYQMALGMAEYRHGNFAAADQALIAAEQAEGAHRHVREAVPFFRVMSLFQQGKVAEAQKLFFGAEAQMKPLPADERQPLANNAENDDVIIWLAYKEAKALLQGDANR